MHLLVSILSRCISAKHVTAHAKCQRKDVKKIYRWGPNLVIRDKHRINKNIPWLGPQKKYSSRASSAAEKTCLVE